MEKASLFTLVLSSLGVFVAWMVYAIKVKAPSISETYYLLQSKIKFGGTLFTALCFIVAFPIMIAWITLSEGLWYQFLSFFAPVGLMFVGVAAQFKEDFVRKVHYGAAIFCMISACLWLLLAGFWWLIAIGSIGFIMLNHIYGRGMYWAELMVFAAAYIGLIFSILGIIL